MTTALLVYIPNLQLEAVKGTMAVRVSSNNGISRPDGEAVDTACVRDIRDDIRGCGET